MEARVANSTARWAIWAAITIASGILVWGAVRHAVAQHWANASNPDQWMRAAELEPSNAENWYRLGRYRQLDFEHTDIPLAISFYGRATEINPVSALYWMDLAGAYETNRQYSQAEQAFRTAQQDYPISAEVAWRFGNFLLRQDRVDEGFQQIHHALSVDPSLTMLAVSVCWRSTQDIDRILASALPEKPGVYWGAIGFFVDANQPDQAVTVWKKLLATTAGTSLPLEKAYPLLDLLLNLGRANDARDIWGQAIAAAGIQSDFGPGGSLIWNGGFESDLLNGGLAWRYRPLDGVAMKFEEGDAHSGNRSLRVDFDGSSNVDFESIWQWVVVKPNTHYRFSAYLRSADLTTDSGIFFQIEDHSHPTNPEQFKQDPTRSTPNVIATQPWSLNDLEFVTGPDTQLLRIVLRRTPSGRFGNKISGTAWVDDVSLVPAPMSAVANP